MIDVIVAVIGVIIALVPVYYDISERKKQDREQHLAILRLTVMSPEMPISERLIAGEKYIKEGGNGDVKQYYEELYKEHIC